MKTRIRENNEWITMRWIDEQQTVEAGLPRLLHIGDSIANGISGALADLMKGSFGVDLFATSKVVSDVEFQLDLEIVLQRHDYDVIIFNNGLHGFEVDDRDYALELEAVLKWLMPQTKILAWRTSTPCFGESLWIERIQQRNAIAQTVVDRLDLPTIDCFTKLSMRSDLSSDGIHFHKEGYHLLARCIGTSVLELW